MYQTLAQQGIAPAEEQYQPDTSLEEYQQERRREAFDNTLWGAALVLLHILLVVFDVIHVSDLFRSLLFIIGVASVGHGTWELLQSKSLTAEDLERHDEAKRFAKSIENTKLTYSKAILACLILVAIIQFLTGDKESIQAAGLVKSAVWKGEVWRLFTCATLHVNFMHIWMNSLALIGFGRLIEAVSSRAYLPIVFLVSAFSGSVFSLLLLPNTTSVGASGGLMGLVGFLAVLGYRQKENLPPGFFKSIVINICFIGALGLVGFAIIDNAAHLGGLLAGAGCGAVLINKRAEANPSEASRFTVGLGSVSLALIAAISLLSIVTLMSQ
jgi:membrane associated rhomboid family serine protease